MCARSALAGVGRVEGELRVDGRVVEQVEFRYLGSLLSCDGDLGQARDVASRVRAASATFGRSSRSYPLSPVGPTPILRIFKIG